MKYFFNQILIFWENVISLFFNHFSDQTSIQTIYLYSTLYSHSKSILCFRGSLNFFKREPLTCLGQPRYCKSETFPTASWILWFLLHLQRSFQTEIKERKRKLCKYVFIEIHSLNRVCILFSFFFSLLQAGNPFCHMSSAVAHGCTQGCKMWDHTYIFSNCIAVNMGGQHWSSRSTTLPLEILIDGVLFYNSIQRPNMISNNSLP